jgi:hypothetical protein
MSNQNNLISDSAFFSKKLADVHLSIIPIKLFLPHYLFHRVYGTKLKGLFSIGKYCLVLGSIVKVLSGIAKYSQVPRSSVRYCGIAHLNKKVPL